MFNNILSPVFLSTVVSQQTAEQDQHRKLCKHYIMSFSVDPSILFEIADSTDEGRDVANFTCQAIGEPAPNISWYFNGTMINESDTSKYRIELRLINSTTTEKTLTVYNVTSSDVGTYTCNVNNTIGSDFSHGKVAINIL